ncbi:MAG: enoyl-CoA hydratase/isomerase family protein [Chthonomonas sp.]|nr:enoyl-CoA hydratase/isomerase family protein [Chthonomonas sp.]
MNACVIGAGTMGAGIAAHLANLGFQVTLLDMSRESAESAFERSKKIRPPHFYNAESMARIRVGGIDQDLSLVNGADWVCEAIIENLDAKKDLFSKIAPILKPGAFVSSNTSSLPLKLLAEGLPDDIRKKLVGTHFFNPPRYLKLLELIPTDETDKKEIQRITAFLEAEVGRRVVLAKDTPGFIANRFGMWAMFHAIHTAEKLGLSAEQVDAICGPFLGRPRSAAFRLNDIVGLDVMSFIAAIMAERCSDDPHLDTLKHPASMDFLMERGWIGQKSGQGYYRKEGKELLAFDLRTQAYRNVQEVSFDSINAVAKKPLGERIRAVLEAKDEAGEFLREHLIPVLAYAQYLKDEVSHSALDFDRVMMWGFGWQMGPFEVIDAIGAEFLGLQNDIYYKDGKVLDERNKYIALPKEPQYRGITDFPLKSENAGFNVRDLGDGVLGIALTTKMGVIGPEVMASLTEWLGGQEGPLVLCSEAKSFSAGFDLKFFLERQEAGDWMGVDEGLAALQHLTVLLSERKVVAAIHGHCLGAGFELATACSMIAAHPEANIGLPESRVGLIPGGAGTCRMRLKFQTSLQDLVTAALLMTRGQVSTSAGEAMTLGYLRPKDVIVKHPDSLISTAKSLATSVVPRSIANWKIMEGPIAGMIDRALNEGLQKGDFTEHDVYIGQQIKEVFRKPSDFDEALRIEREVFIDLLKEGLSVARIRHMLEIGKPLRN